MLEHSRRVVQSCMIVRTSLLRTFDPGNRGLSHRHVPPLRCFISLRSTRVHAYLKLVPLSSFGPVHKYWSRSDKRDKFCKRSINF